MTSAPAMNSFATSGIASMRGMSFPRKRFLL